MPTEEKRPLGERRKHKICYVTTIDGLDALVALHDADPTYIPLIAVRHPACFDVALLHKRKQYEPGYHHDWNEQAAVLTAAIGLGPDVFSNIAAMIGAFPAYGPRPDYTKPEAYREVAKHIGRIRDSLGAWGYKSAKVGVDFERGGQWVGDPDVQPDADDGLATVALAGAFDDNGQRADFVLPVWRRNRLRAMETIAASDRQTVLIAPVYWPSRVDRRPHGTTPQLWGSPVDPDFSSPGKPWSKLYTCEEMVAYDGDAMIYFRVKHEREGFAKMADLIDAASKPAVPTAPPKEPDPTDPTDPDVEPEPSIIPRTDPDDLDDVDEAPRSASDGDVDETPRVKTPDNELRDMVGHKKYDAVIKAAKERDTSELRKANPSGSEVVGKSPL